MSWMKQIKLQPWFIKLTHWEYWSFNTVYLPIIWYWFYLSLKARSFFFFNASNPSIKYGGFLMESKWDIYPLLPQLHTPLTAIIRKNSTIKQLLSNAALFQFPIVCKPDLGSRGRGVAIIHNEHELLAYQRSCPLDFLLQEKIDYPLEAGIFYVRMPGEKNGIITGVVEKEFLQVTGDGFTTIRQLLMRNNRFMLQLPVLETMLGNAMEDIPCKGETRLLVPFGNHARGCKFINASFRITAELTQSIDEVCGQIDGFYFGRLDIRFQSWHELEKGNCFSIIELNGAGSEPTHMYGSKTVFAAWREIIAHWKWLYRISAANHKNGVAYLSYQESKAMFSNSKRCDKMLAQFEFVPRNASATVDAG